MVACDLCGKEFKTGQGLAGHRHLKHAGQHSAERSGGWSVGAHATAGGRLARAEDSAAERWGEQQQRLLEQIQE